MQKNIVIIHSDALVYNQLGCMGCTTINTPHIDALSQQGGILFENAYACSGVCTPSRASLMTGRYPIGHGVSSNFQTLHAAEKTMGKIFDENNYRTGYFGEIDHGSENDDPAKDGWQNSFVRGTDYNQYLKDQKIDIRYPEGSEISDKRLRYWQVGKSNIPEAHYLENVVTDKSIEFLKKESPSPFLCFVGLFAPHNPFTPPGHYATMYKPEDMVLSPRSETELEGKHPVTQKWIKQN